MSNQPNRMDIRQFREAGYLQEANRQFFHPLGLALEVEVDGWTDEALVRHKLATVLGEQPTSEQVGAVLIFLLATGLDQPRISGVWDYRDDPEGICYSWETFTPTECQQAIERADRIATEEAQTAQTRLAALGWRVQPLPGE